MKTTDLAQSYEQEIVRLVPLVESSLEQLREHTRATVIVGSQLGGMIEEGKRGHKDDLWSWLRSLPVAIREDTVQFALKAYRTRERHPELEDISQLQFALIAPAPAAADDGTDADDGTNIVERPAPKSRGEDGAFLELLKLVQRATALLGKLKLTSPPSGWSKINAISMLRSLDSLAALHKELSRLTAR